jgi:cell division transport system permease protein
MMRALRYAFDEAILSLWRGRQSGLLSTLTIAVALFVLGGFLLVTANLERLGAEWSSAAEMSVYLKDDVTPDERRAIETALAPGELVAGREYVSKTDALGRFKQTFTDLAGAVDTFGSNPLPASYEVRLRTGPAAQTAVDALGQKVRQMPGVADVHARRDEIDIMQLGGAPQAYIRGPFVMEGVLQGGIGALVALAVLSAAFFALRARYLVPLASAINLSSVRFLPWELCFFVVLGGMAVGCLGGLVAAWNR